MFNQLECVIVIIAMYINGQTAISLKLFPTEVQYKDWYFWYMLVLHLTWQTIKIKWKSFDCVYLPNKRMWTCA